MSALPPEQARSMRQAVKAAAQPVDALTQRWTTLHEQAAQIAELAGLAQEKLPADGEELAATLAVAQPWQSELAWQGVEDIEAILQPGLAALRVLTSRGQDAVVPALALWCEFYSARAAVLKVLHGAPQLKAA